MNRRQWLRLLLGSAAFGFLMGVREEFNQMWLRILIAAVAFVVLVGTIGWTRQVRS